MKGFSIENFRPFVILIVWIVIFCQILDHILHCFNSSILFERDHKSIDVFNTRVLGNGNLMISDIRLQHAGVYVCRATTPGTRNFTVAMATLTVLGMFPFFLQLGESYILVLAVLPHSLFPLFSNSVAFM